jgi:hypothetical protein
MRPAICVEWRARRGVRHTLHPACPRATACASVAMIRPPTRKSAALHLNDGDERSKRPQKNISARTTRDVPGSGERRLPTRDGRASERLGCPAFAPTPYEKFLEWNHRRLDVIEKTKAILAGGERGIRTPGTLPGTVVFKTTAIDHSAISPCVHCSRRRVGEPARRTRASQTGAGRSRAAQSGSDFTYSTRSRFS